MARILIIEEDMDTREYLTDILTQYAPEKYKSTWTLRFTKVGTAQDALTIMKQHNFELLVSDIGIARQDGWEFITELRKMSNHFDLPIVVLSAIGGDELEYEAKRSGASLWFTKPVDPKPFVDAVFTLITER